MAIKLIASDMDDTLLGPDGRVSARTKAAIQAVMHRGVRFILASGRMPAAMRSTARELGVSGPVISYNGALTIDIETGEILHRQSVPLDLAREAAKLARRLGGHVQAYHGDKYFFANENQYSRAYAASVGVEGSATGVPIDQWLSDDVEKLLVIGERSDISKWAESMQAHFGDRLSCAISRPHYIEIFNARADKAEALRRLCEHMHICAQDAAAFGDGQNDLGMVSLVSRGYIMQNARPDVLARAPQTAPSNAQDGLAITLEALLSDGSIA